MDFENIKKQFVHYGFVIIPMPDLFQRIPFLLGCFDNLINKAEYLGQNGLVKIRKSDFEVITSNGGWSWGCDHIFSSQLCDQNLLDIVSIEPIPTIVHYILGDKVRWTAGHGLWSPKNYDYYLHWHRDTRRDLWKKGNPFPCSHIQICVALQDESVIWIVPSSHVRNLENWEYKYIEENHKYDNHPDQVIVKIPAGSALIFNTYSLHRAECSKDNIRRAIHFGFTSVNTSFNPELYRLGNHFEWLNNADFIQNQSEFLQRSIQEEQIFQSNFLCH